MQPWLTFTPQTRCGEIYFIKRWNGAHNFKLIHPGVGQDCGVWTEDWRSSVAPDLQWRQREGQVRWRPVSVHGLPLHDTLTECFLCFSPTPHLHFSIKHPHTLSWEYYKMFQCKAHLVMRLIENRISMEFMLQVNKRLCLFSFAIISVIFLFFTPQETQFACSNDIFFFRLSVGLQQAPQSRQYCLFPEIPESDVESDASVHSCLP